jgi:outer membrane protein TolC
MRDALSIALIALILSPLPAAAQEGAPGPALKRYTFAEALERAQARNPTAAQAQQEILRAEALVRQAASGSLPTLTGTATGQVLDRERAIGDRVIQSAESLSGNVTLAVPIVSAQRWLQWVHARDSAVIARASADDVRRSLALATARAYLAVVAGQRGVEVGDRAWKTAQAHFDYAHGRRQGGVGNRIDEVRAEQEVETTRAQAQLARSGLVKAQEALGVLLAEDGRVDAAPEVTLPDPPGLDAALADAAERRTDVQVLERRAEAARRVTRDSYADFLPTISGQFLFVFQYPPTSTTREAGWQAQAILSVPLYDGGKSLGTWRERRALEEEAEIAVDGAKRQVSADVRAAFEALHYADEALGAARRSAELALETLELANQAYRAGATTNLEVIDAERRARDAETAVAVAEDTARQSRLDLLAASGRFP